MSLTEQHSTVSPGTDLSSLWRSAADFLMYLPWKYILPVLQTVLPPDTSRLFSVLPFPPLPILWNVAFLTCITVEFHCIPQKFKQKLFFRQLTGFYYFISQTKGTPQIYRLFLIGVEAWWWPLQAETCSFIIRIHLSKLWVVVLFDYTSSLSLVSHTTGMTHPEGVIKHTFTPTQNTKFPHNLCTSGNY